MSKTKWLTAFMVFAAISTSAWADQNTANITVKIAINAAPCDIDDIDVDFGSEVPVTDVAAGLAEKSVDYNLDCSSMNTSRSLKMVIQGVGASFDANALKTSIPDLGIKIQANGSDYPLNTALNFTNASSKPVLTALLVQKPGVTLDAGDFNATATMMVDYQ